MKILAIDPGATRAGWSALSYSKSNGVSYIASGVIYFPRKSKQAFQQYRMELTKHWVSESFHLLDKYQPGILVSETVPSRGPEIMDQLYLANVQITVLHTLALSYGTKIEQVSARSVQSKIALRKKDLKVTKPQVRNGVLLYFPDLKDKLKSCGSSVYEESDAIAVGLYYCDFILKEKLI